MHQFTESMLWQKLVILLIPDSRLRVLEDAGHAPMIEVPEKTAHIYLDFIGSQREAPDIEMSAGRENL